MDIKNSRVGDSNSNARVERAIQHVGGLTRTMKASLDSRLGMKISLDHSTVHLLINHAAASITKDLIRDCGASSYKLIKRRLCIEPIAEVWESVLSKPSMTSAAKAQKEAWRDRLVEGIYLGSSIRTSETLIGTGHVVFNAGAIRRRLVEERLSRHVIDHL